ncbi:MAG: branched-chain amino acid ABC transporter substrate-binding protein [Dehalococcoidia bacterium]|nr:MAG: branched-chain amino acid ABC transporter substrate-binding protein [Dehalococcoidia bacterium]
MKRLLLSLGLVIALLAPACAQTGGPTTPGQGTGGGEPIVLGAIDTISGPNAQVGTDGVNGARIAVQQINERGGILGRQVRLEVRDEQLKPDVTVQALRELNSQGVRLTFGYTSSADCLAAIPVAAEIGSIVMGSHCAAMPQTTDRYDPHFVRTAANDAMYQGAQAEFVRQRFPTIRDWDVFGYDYVTGRDQWAKFQEETRKALGAFNPGREVWVSLTETDYRSFITRMLSDLPADSAQNRGLFLAMFGAGVENLAKQGKPFDFFKKWRVAVVNMAMERLAQTLRADTPDLWNVYDYYYAAYDTPMNKEFVDAYRRAYNDFPSAWSYQGYISVWAYKAAIEKAGSTDVNALIRAFDSGVTFESPSGPISIRGEDHQAAARLVAYHITPDASTPEGWRVTEFVVLQPDRYMPPVNVRR